MQMRGFVTRMRFTIIIFILSFAVLFMFCTDRDRNNPLDPKNPSTHGRMSHVRIYSQEHKVVILWEKLEIRGLQAIQVYRKADTDSNFKFIGSTSGSSYYYVDSTAIYGMKYEYYVTALVDGYDSPPSEYVTITPGPTYTWVADIESGYLTRLTHDLQGHIFDFGIMSFPCLIASSPGERSAWVYSRFSESIYKVNSNGHPDVQLFEYKDITHMAVDTVTNDLWLCIQDQSSILRLNSSGELLKSCREIHSPKRLAVNPRSHNCYVIDSSSNAVFNVTADGKIGSRINGLISPQDIIYDQKNDKLWIADSTRILVFDKNGQMTTKAIEGLFWASFIALDCHRNTCWIIDMEPIGQNASLLKLTADGQTQFELASFKHPMSIAVNEFDGSCLVADVGAARLFQISEDGSRVSIVGNYYAPYAVAVEHH
jgi:hypothetical protein